MLLPVIKYRWNPNTSAIVSSTSWDAKAPTRQLRSKDPPKFPCLPPNCNSQARTWGAQLIARSKRPQGHRSRIEEKLPQMVAVEGEMPTSKVSPSAAKAQAMLMRVISLISSAHRATQARETKAPSPACSDPAMGLTTKWSRTTIALGSSAKWAALPVTTRCTQVGATPASTRVMRTCWAHRSRDSRTM